ncbi:MAG: hypothetical protein DWB45_06725 [Xanthomonadales bacterium]|nr:MAG: hypothetical protein F9K31_06720 [Dokdonella sp.]MBC6942400.1 hypothetical protein [Xanthomonadales bacterium]MDL1870331.1 hypothetical protein [Gammaproteobacteria bacterium PRO6]
MLLAPLSLPDTATRTGGPRSTTLPPLHRLPQRRAKPVNAAREHAPWPVLLHVWWLAGLAVMLIAPNLWWSRAGGWSAAFWLLGAPLLDLAWLARRRLGRGLATALKAAAARRRRPAMRRQARVQQRPRRAPRAPSASPAPMEPLQRQS